MGEAGGKIVLAGKFFEDCDRIEDLQEKAEITRQYFEAMKTPKPENLEVRKYSKPDGIRLAAAPEALIIFIYRRKFVVLYSESRNMLGYVEMEGSAR